MTLKAHVKTRTPAVDGEASERLEWINDVDIAVDEDGIHIGGRDGFISISLYDMKWVESADEPDIEDGHEVLTDIVADAIEQYDGRGREFELGGDDEG